MRLENSWKARRRLPATFALLTLLFGLLLAGLLSAVAYEHERAEKEAFVLERAKSIADGLNYITDLIEARNDLPALQRIIETTATDRWMKYILITDVDDKIVASSQRDLIGLPVRRNLRGPDMSDEIAVVIRTGQPFFHFDAEKHVYEYFRPLTRVDSSSLVLVTTGVVCVAIDGVPIYEDLWRNVWVTTLVILGITLIGMIGIYVSIHRVVTRPLRRVVQAAKNLSGGDFRARTGYRSPNEIGDLSRTFDEMADELEEGRQALQSSEDRYRTIFEASPLGFILLDRSGAVLDMNSSILIKICGDRPVPDDIVGKLVWELPIFSDPRLQEALREIPTGRHFSFEKMTLPAGSKAEAPVANLRGVPLNARPGRPETGLVTVEFVTEQVHLERQLLQAQKMESIGVLAGGVAHDFNNILVGILGYASLAKETTPDPLIREYLDVIEQSAMRAADLTRQLLAFARKGKYQVRPIEINELIREIHHLIKESFDRSISITLDLQTHLPAVEGDAGQIHQALLNICVNARDAMPEGGKLDVSTRLVKDAKKVDGGDVEPGRSFVEICIADTGIGMDPGTRAKIFEPFFTTKPEGKGTGLGLATVYGIVTAHGGMLDVQSDAGSGTRFKVLLPISSQKGAVIEKMSGDRPAGKGEMILVADDETVIRDLVETVLSSHGYRVVVAGNGVEAVQLYHSKRREIRGIILDNVMPIMGGKQAVRELRKLDAEVPIILATGYGQDGEIQELLQYAHLEFLQKPFSVSTLLQTVHRVLDPNIVSGR